MSNRPNVNMQRLSPLGLLFRNMH